MKSGRVVPPSVFFFLRIALAILGLLRFHIHFRIICSSSVKNVMGNLIVLVAQLCLTLCDPMDCSSPGSSVHGIFQATILE